MLKCVFKISGESHLKYVEQYTINNTMYDWKENYVKTQYMYVFCA